MLLWIHSVRIRIVSPFYVMLLRIYSARTQLYIHYIHNYNTHYIHNYIYIYIYIYIHMYCSRIWFVTDRVTMYRRNWTGRAIHSGIQQVYTPVIITGRALIKQCSAFMLLSNRDKSSCCSGKNINYCISLPDTVKLKADSTLRPSFLFKLIT
jgi:hypothetical protein